ncbi:MAG: electron transport complex subunit E [Methylococcaceae bacterium]|jgi:electron transport complex protein RnfE|nr:electron transport complex subunit E [Methylococcaceae bacterium]
MKTTPPSYLQLARDGLWNQNQALVALLGLCPLLAVSTSLINGLALGLATTATLILSNGLVSALRFRIARDARLPLFVLLIASIVTAIDIGMNAWFHELHGTLGLFIPLIVTNCAILGRAEAFASRQTTQKALADGLFMGFGFTMVITLLGGLREVIGTGHLFRGAEGLFGLVAADWEIELLPGHEGFLLALLPPGAFIGLGLLIAMKNLVDEKMDSRRGSLDTLGHGDLHDSPP